MKANKKTFSKFGAVALVIGLSVAGYVVLDQVGRDKARAAATAPAPAIPVTVATAENKDVPVIVHGIGTVQAYNTVVVKSRVDGQIVKVDFKEGQDVKAAIRCSRSIPGRSRRRSSRRSRQARGRGAARRRPARPRPLRQAGRLGLPDAAELRPAEGDGRR